MSMMTYGTPGAALSRQLVRSALLALIASVGVSTALHAQAGSKPGDQPRQVSAVATRSAAAQLAGLELSGEQKARIQVITAKYADATQAAMNGMANDREDAVRKLLAVRAKMLPEVRAVLTTAQRDLFDRNMAELQAVLGVRP